MMFGRVQSKTLAIYFHVNMLRRTGNVEHAALEHDDCVQREKPVFIVIVETLLHAAETRSTDVFCLFSPHFHPFDQ